MEQGASIFTDQYLMIPWSIMVMSFGVALFAGFVKGLVGFAMPMIIISGLSSLMSPELALAGLILPTIVSNVWQALRQGLEAALESIRSFKVFLLVGGVVLAGSAQLVTVLSQSVLFLIIGIPVTMFAVMQMLGWRFSLRERTWQFDTGVGAFTGFIGGLSGVWGPPTVAYLTAVNTPKAEQVRVQGTIYGLGAVLLFFAHLKSGVLTSQTLQVSALLVPPAMVGIAIGFRVQDRVNQSVFRNVTLAVLCIAGVNLIRKGLLG